MTTAVAPAATDLLRPVTFHTTAGSDQGRRMAQPAPGLDGGAEVRSAVRAIGGPTAAARVTGMSTRQMRRWASGAVRRPRRRDAVQALLAAVTARQARRAQLTQARRRSDARPVPAARPSLRTGAGPRRTVPAQPPPTTVAASAVVVPPCQGSQDWDLTGGRYVTWLRAIRTCQSCPLLTACRRYRDVAFPGARPRGVIWAGDAHSPREGHPLDRLSLRTLASQQLREINAEGTTVATSTPAVAGPVAA